MTADPLIGKKVVNIRKMTETEMEREGWHETSHGMPTVIVFQEGTVLYASMDPEGNGYGALFGVAPNGTQFSF